MRTLRQDHSEFNCIFVHSDLDDLGLDPFAFRIYAHLARRANGKDRAWPGIASMAEKCRMSRQTIVNAIRKLEEINLVRVIRKQGSSSVYLLTPPSTWKKALVDPYDGSPTSAQSRPVPKVDRSKLSTTPVSKLDCHQSKLETGRISKEGNPLKENTVDEVFDPQDLSSSSPNSNGRMPNGTPAVSTKSSSRNPTQDSVRRKAFAIAARLEGFHWDNCKVLYAKHTARSYAEKSLREGHCEEAIKAAYESALKHCHGVATDEMDRGERFRQEKASPALVVWLAERELAQDGKTPDERWDEVNAQLQSKHEKRLADDQRVHEEISRLAPQISTWFTRQTFTETPQVSSTLSISNPNLKPKFIHE